MVNEGRGRLFRRKDGKFVIYLPKDFAEDSMFPFKGTDSIFVKVKFKPGGDKLLIEKWSEPIPQEEEILSFNEKTKMIISEVEKSPLQFTSRDILDELKDWIKNDKEIDDIRESLTISLNEFTKKKFGVSIDEETRKFLLNELVYLTLKLTRGDINEPKKGYVV